VPVKQKYGKEDLVGRPDHLPATLAYEHAQTFGLASAPGHLGAGQIYWGPEDTWLGDARYSGERELAEPFRKRDRWA